MSGCREFVFVVYAPTLVNLAMTRQERLVELNIPGVTSLLQIVHGSHDRVISERIIEDRCWEPFETSILVASLQEGHCFLDIGANIGYFTLVAASLVGDEGLVYSVEPEPSNFHLMTKSLYLNKLSDRVIAKRLALSNRDGREKLFLSPNNLGDHQLYPDTTVRESISVILRHGSRLLSTDIKRLDFIKIDTQGSEYQILEGLKPLLSKWSSLPRMLIELTPFSLRMAGNSGTELVNLLEALGARLWIVDHVQHELLPTTPKSLCSWCNNVDAVLDDRGFLNIFVGESPF